MGKLQNPPQGLVPVEDLGGPTPENYKTDDDSAKLKTPGATLKQVKDVVNKGAKPGDQAMPKLKKEEEEIEAPVIEEEEVTTDEVVAEEETVEEEELNVEEDVNALLGGEELSEEFKEKAKTIFEAALKTKVKEIKENLEAQYEEKVADRVAEAKEELGNRVDSYLEYVSEEWFTENELAIEHGLKTELTESFLSGMKGLFEEHYVTIPDDKSVADGILDSVSEGLASTQKEKLASLSESVEFESENQYREKLEMLKESYFPTGKSSKATSTETLSEGVDSAPVTHSGGMAAYLKTLSAVAKN
jgi:hypothetical protein